jgi:hypothetical protein
LDPVLSPFVSLVLTGCFTNPFYAKCLLDPAGGASLSTSQAAMKTFLSTTHRVFRATVSAAIIFVLPSFAEPAATAPSNEGNLVVDAWRPTVCGGEPIGCTLAGPYVGTFSIRTMGGEEVTPATTDINGSFSVLLKPGRYRIVPANPSLAERAVTVTVPARQVTYATILMPPR